MKHKIDNLKVVLGQFIRVNNMDKFKEPKKHRSDANQYVSLQVESYDGKDEWCILFTYQEHTDLEIVSLPKEFVSKMVEGRLYPATINRNETYVALTKHWDGRPRIVRISKCQLAEANYRAFMHPHTITEKSKITDMFD